MPQTFWARTDSNSAGNPALNLNGDAALEITFVHKDPNGDLFLDQPTGGGVDPDTEVNIGGTLYDFTFELSGDLPTTNNNGAQQVPDHLEGKTGYIITVQDYPTTGETTRLFFIADGTATQTDMDDFGKGAIDLQNVDETPSPAAVCFAAGTLILTPKGEVAVEELTVGDLVTTLDGPARPIKWIGATSLTWPGSPESSRPILIAANALGPGIPQRDLIVSPQHKMLMSGRDVRDLFDDPEVLAPAKGLTEMRGIRKMNGKKDITYFHVLLDRHSILYAERAASESFYPGPTAMTMLRRSHHQEILKLFPSLTSDPMGGYGARARICLTHRQTERLVLQLPAPQPGFGARRVNYSRDVRKESA